MKTNAPELLAVEQCDRDAAAPLMRNNVVTWKDQYEAYVRKGEYDNSPLVQAFARHRIETRPALPDVAGLVSQGRAAVERLANLPLGCTLMEWSEISAPLLDALTALSRLPPRTGDDQVEAVLELRMDQTGRVEVGPDDPLYKAFRPSKEAVAAIEQNEAANAAALSAMRDMMVGHVENWPEPKKFSTAIALIDKTFRAALTLSPSRDDALEEACAAVIRAAETREEADRMCAAIRAMKGDGK